MGETLDTAFLKTLPAWKSLEVARQEKLRSLDQAILAKGASLKALAGEVPLTASSGMVFGAGNESLDLEQQFTRSKEEISHLQEALAQTIRMDTRVLNAPGRACHGSLVVARNLKAPDRWTQRVFRLVLLSEPEAETANGIEHVELSSPLGRALLGIAQGQAFKIGLGPDHVLAEVEEVI
jgi:transcription elongation GreA/GreB family factor